MSQTSTNAGISGIERKDTLVAPNDRVYSVVTRYVDADDTLRLKLRAAPQRQMYIAAHRLDQLVRDGDWEYVSSHSEDTAEQFNKDELRKYVSVQ